MSYPGEGYKMSNYGLKRYSPEQLKEQWRENIDRQIKVQRDNFIPLNSNSPQVKVPLGPYN